MSMITVFLILLVAVFATVAYFTGAFGKRQANSASGWTPWIDRLSRRR